SAAAGAFAFGTAIALAALWSFAAAPAFDQVPFRPDQRVLPLTEDMTFSQFAHTGTWKFVAFMIFWTAFHGMLYTVLLSIAKPRDSAKSQSHLSSERWGLFCLRSCFSSYPNRCAGVFLGVGCCGFA
ncbi:hypothetical protein, partial [Brevibacterium paucivorans]|uniref:hypothetical protein n=1 Tax=Brevibacterium paucivorans TaxID=170994 RepID=UPI001CA5BA55